MRLVIPHVKVIKIEEKFKEVWRAGRHPDPVEFEKISLGWFMHLEGSHEALFVGSERPEIKEGAKVTITIEEEVDGKVLRHKTER